jgi:hypothetical protein
VLKQIYKGQEGQVVSVKTMQSSQYFGRGTRWCISAQMSDNEFKTYYGDDKPIFMFLPKNSAEKYAFAVHENLFRNAKDSALNDVPQDLGRLLIAGLTSENKQVLYKYLSLDNAEDGQSHDLAETRGYSALFKVRFWEQALNEAHALQKLYPKEQKRIDLIKLNDGFNVHYQCDYGEMLEPTTNFARVLVGANVSDCDYNYAGPHPEYVFMTPNRDVCRMDIFFKGDERLKLMSELPDDLKKLIVHTVSCSDLAEEEGVRDSFLNQHYWDAFETVFSDSIKKNDQSRAVKILALLGHNHNADDCLEWYETRGSDFSILGKNANFIEKLAVEHSKGYSDLLDNIGQTLVKDAIELSRKDPQAALKQFDALSKHTCGYDVKQKDVAQLSEDILGDDKALSVFVAANGYNHKSYGGDFRLRKKLYEVYGAHTMGLAMQHVGNEEQWRADIKRLKDDPQFTALMTGGAGKQSPLIVKRWSQVEADSEDNKLEQAHKFIHIKLLEILGDKYHGIWSHEHSNFTDIEQQVIQDTSVLEDLDFGDMTLEVCAIAVSKDPTYLQDVPPSTLKAHTDVFFPHFSKLDENDPIKGSLKRFFKDCSEQKPKSSLNSNAYLNYDPMS